MRHVLGLALALLCALPAVSPSALAAERSGSMADDAVPVAEAGTLLGDGGTSWYRSDRDLIVDERIEVTGDVHLILEDGTTLEARAGITVPEGSSLTICGQTGQTGTLLASGQDSSAGIGGAGVGSGEVAHASRPSSGQIRIDGGRIVATSQKNAAGIGAGRGEHCGDITIAGGVVEATGGYNGAGIGCGMAGEGGLITILGGTVKATGGRGGAGIGAATSSQADRVIICGGTVEATGGIGAAGIGGGRYYYGGEITITGGTVTAHGGRDGAGIGSGAHGYGSDTDISGGTVTAYGNGLGAGIGTGMDDRSETNVTISGGSVTAIGSPAGAGIGCGGNSFCAQVSITGGTVHATGGDGAAGIGGSEGGTCDLISILGGQIDAYGGAGAAGIGGGRGTPMGDITIGAGTVRATGGSEGDDVGCGHNGYTWASSVTITGGSVYRPGKGGKGEPIAVTYDLTDGIGELSYCAVPQSAATPGLDQVQVAGTSYPYRLEDVSSDADGLFHIYLPLPPGTQVDIDTAQGPAGPPHLLWWASAAVLCLAGALCAALWLHRRRTGR